MRLEGRIDIDAPIGKVWALVIDPVGLAACVPGVREVRQVDERTFEGSITASIGPMEGDFSFRSTLSLDRPPEDLKVRLEGTDSVTNSRLEGDVAVVLTESDGRTALAYHATVTVKGRLAILGEMVLRATAGLMIGQVVACLRTRLEASASAADAATPAAGSDGGAVD